MSQEMANEGKSKTNMNYKRNEYSIKDKNNELLPNNLNAVNRKDLYIFKDEILKEMKKIEININDKLSKKENELQAKIDSINNILKELNLKNVELNERISKYDLIWEKFDSFEKIKNKLLDNLLINELKIKSVEKDMSDSIFEINNILKFSVLYKGVIGTGCKYKNFHDLIDFLLNQISLLANYKEKSSMDINSYKKKLDGIINGFRLQLENIQNNFVKIVSDNFKSCNNKITKIVNDTKDEMEEFRNILSKNYDELNDKVNDFEFKIYQNLNEVKRENLSFSTNLKEYVNDLKNMKDNFNKLSQYSSLNLQNQQFNTMEFDFDNMKQNNHYTKENVENIRKNIISKNESNSHTMDKINSKGNLLLNLKLGVENSNYSKNIKNTEKKSETSNDIQVRQLSKDYDEYSSLNINNNSKDYKRKFKENKTIKKEKERIKSEKNTSKAMMLKSNNFIQRKSSFGHKTETKLQNLEIKKNFIKKNSKESIKNKSNNFNIWLENVNRVSTLSNEKMKKPKKLGNNKYKFISSNFKNILLTLEGPKNMVIDRSNRENGKDIYHIETKINKKSMSQNRITSSKPFINTKEYIKFHNAILAKINDELISNLFSKNQKLSFMNKSESHNNLHNSNEESKPFLNITRLSMLNRNQVKSFDEKNIQTDINY